MLSEFFAQLTEELSYACVISTGYSNCRNSWRSSRDFRKGGDRTISRGLWPEHFPDQTTATFIYRVIWRTNCAEWNPILKKRQGKAYEAVFWSILRKNIFGWISAYLKGVDGVRMYRNSNFSNYCNIDELILLFLWTDTWILSGKSCSSWRCVMQFLPGAEKTAGLKFVIVHSVFNNSLSTSKK
jgi:hypothetical protein